MKLPLFWQYLPKDIQARFGQKHLGKQRAMLAQGHLLLVLHKVPQPDNRERETALFWRKPDGSWDSTQGSGLLRLMEHVEEYELAEAKLCRDYERAKEAEDYFEILGQTSPLLHAAKNLHATLQAAREGIPQEHDLIDLRDRAYEVERTLDLLPIFRYPLTGVGPKAWLGYNPRYGRWRDARQNKTNRVRDGSCRSRLSGERHFDSPGLCVCD